jgi:hypothetical protein
VQTPGPTRSSRKTVVLSVLALVVVGLLGLRLANVIHPTSCTSCHSRGAFGTQTEASAHAGVQCEKCHIAPGIVGRAVFTLKDPLHGYLTLSRKANRDAAAVADARCKSCHEEALKGAVVEAKGIRVNHATCAVDAACTDCHSSVAHGSATPWIRSYNMDACLECHLTQGSTGCDTCHVGEQDIARVKSAFTVTHGPNWKTAHAMGDIATCAVCHSSGDCADCHGAGVPHEADFIDAHSTYASESAARCATCHESSFCSDCHGTKMPHPASFTEGHAQSAAADQALCERCHDEADCTECHLKHVHPGGAVGATTPSKGGR